MYKLVIRNYSKQVTLKYIPSKYNTWCYNKGYYKVDNKGYYKVYKKKNKYVSECLSDSIINYYYNKYKYRIK